MGKLALPVFMGLILAAFWRDVKQYPRFSKTIWVAFLWVSMTSSRPFSVWFFPNRFSGDPENIDFLQGNPIERSILLIFISVGLILIIRRKEQYSFRFKENWGIILLFAYALMSINWSPYPAIALKRFVRSFGDILMVLLILSEKNRTKTLEHFLRRLAIIMIPLSVMLVKYFPELGILYDKYGNRTWGGVTIGKNSLGIMCAFLGVFLIWRVFQRLPKIDIFDIILILFTVYLLNGARSATSNVLFISGALLSSLQKVFKYNPAKLKSAMIVFISAILLFQLALAIFPDLSLRSFFFSATNRDPSFTGRAVLWETVIDIGMKKPLFGEGFSSFWLKYRLPMAEIFAFRPNQAHNGYIEMFLNLGFFGLALLLATIGKSIRRLGRAESASSAMNGLLFVFLLMIIVQNVTEASIFVPTYFISIVFLLTSMVVGLEDDVSDALNGEESFDGLSA